MNKRKTLSIEEFISESIKEDRLSFLGTDDENPFDKLEKKELIEIVARAIDSVLNDSEKMVLSLFFKEGLKQKEIANIMNITPARVTQIKKAALKKIRGFLKDYGL